MIYNGKWFVLLFLVTVVTVVIVMAQSGSKEERLSLQCIYVAICPEDPNDLFSVPSDTFILCENEIQMIACATWNYKTVLCNKDDNDIEKLFFFSKNYEKPFFMNITPNTNLDVITDTYHFLFHTYNPKLVQDENDDFIWCTRYGLEKICTFGHRPSSYFPHFDMPRKILPTLSMGDISLETMTSWYSTQGCADLFMGSLNIILSEAKNNEIHCVGVVTENLDSLPYDENIILYLTTHPLPSCPWAITIQDADSVQWWKFRLYLWRDCIPFELILEESVNDEILLSWKRNVPGLVNVNMPSNSSLSFVNLELSRSRKKLYRKSISLKSSFCPFSYRRQWREDLL